MLKLLEQSGAVLDGHFELQAGAHSQYFLRFSQVGWEPVLVQEAARRLIACSQFSVENATILCPESAGYLLGYEIARQAGNSSLAVTRVDERRRPLASLGAGGLSSGMDVVVVNDVATTGSSMKCLVQLARDQGANVRGILAFAATREPEVEHKLQELKLKGGWLMASLWETYKPGTETCPLCQASKPLLQAWEFN
ncbi:hypothetical protein LXT21_31655 [Myxococcus sp. K38C18041901]|uniref:phosphoribosyltransferase family protein n=1 Tax=Myxococcus guangdongensis TaxID=2906760 RepID=UPI0020A7F9BB|nr:phosphoribosyltransferase family protein [Myxococcus guangdongensis]MCP3063345.1 hypothetical protein [Myxococcus guangdongensis]